jgi:hypothetical protein
MVYTLKYTKLTILNYKRYFLRAIFYLRNPSRPVRDKFHAKTLKWQQEIILISY